MRIAFFFAAPILLLTSLAAHGAEVSLFVSPNGNDGQSGRSRGRAFATITRARDEIRKLKQEGPLSSPVTVYLGGGLHLVDEPIVFTAEDSGNKAAPVVYTARGSERPVVSGGRPVKGWTRGANGVWTTTIDDVKAGKWHFNQLYINGRARRRARTPNEGFYRVKGFPEGTSKTVNYHTDCQSFEFAPGDIRPDWHNLEDVEVIVYHFWTDSHLPIQAIDTAKNVVTFKHKAGKVFTDDFTEAGARYIVENVYEALDAPGEWYLDRKTGVLSYLPLPGEDLASAQVIAPAAPALMVFKGDPVQREFVEHLQFRGISFEYANFQLPPGNSNDAQGSASVPAAIQATGLRNCAFERCAFRNLGTWAIDLKDGCRNNRFTANELSNLAAGGIRINGGTEQNHPLRASGGNLIADNRLHHWGEVYPSAVGVLLMNTGGNTVEHNDIHHGWYTGISIGWKWGYLRSVSRDNRIEYNHIHDIGQGLLSDMGGIYTLGVSPGTVIRYNHIHDVESNQYGGWGIYHDEGSTHILTEKNLVYNTKYCGFNIHYAKECTVRNNIFAFGRIDQIALGRVEPHVSAYFQNNIVYWTEGVLMRDEKPDEPYKFWAGANRKLVDLKETVYSDWNLFYNPRQKPEEVRVGKRTLADWQKRGKDTNSQYADPMFVDPQERNFRLRPGSPAFALGFEEFDIGSAGARGPSGP
jgi:parallel beta-helix repeat protein